MGEHADGAGCGGCMVLLMLLLLSAAAVVVCAWVAVVWVGASV